MFIALFNLGSVIVLSIALGLFLAYSGYPASMDYIHTWDEFAMFRDLYATWSTYSFYLAWTIFAIVIIMLIVDIVWLIYKKES